MNKLTMGTICALAMALSLGGVFNTAQAEDLGAILSPAKGKVWHVCKANGKNKNAATKEAPMKNIDKAVKKAKAGDTIAVCGGNYSGTFDIGYIESDKPLKMYGSFSQDFSARDTVKTPSMFQPDNKSGGKSRKALLTFKKEVKGTVIDGFTFDMGMRNSYHKTKGMPEGVETGMLLLPPAKAKGEKPTVQEPCFKIASAAKAGDVTIQNNVFANCAMGGVFAGIRGGKYTVKNNVFVANRMRAIEIFGTCAAKGGPKSHTKCGEVEIANNTILFTWSRLKDFGDMGYGVRVMKKAAFNIHHNVIGTSIMAGVDHSRFNKDDWIKLDNNVFFVNKTADLHYTPESNTKLNLKAEQFEDLELGSVTGNKTEVPKSFAVNQKYLEGFLAARYTEEADYDPNSSANQLRAAVGLNKQGKLKTKVSMFANRYPVNEALKLFGALAGAGAQIVK